ncbi:GNAT family N-acetyltransferase [Metabacillus bambusae]|uniref:GNAT family N-acetyltransferase n=1 Tax=Metabacillus bambusae TaxID=2795218 RepID=A0ABS3N026_9BACI|nr:GNAT family N-acetyltransferase [Metabacillus bambusae]MBO1511558.1 GNAT family N-acetyltransferase [Metabacillus bambusae]
MLEIRQINPEDTYLIRHNVLRPNQSIEACKFENDHQEDSFHLGAFYRDTLISIASFHKEKNPCFDEELQYRLRGMATLTEYRKLKAGSSLLLHGEALLKEKNVQLWWCNARVSVSDYYKKFGLTEYGEVFDIEPIGLHKLMYKKI